MVANKIEYKKTIANDRYGNRSTVWMLIKASPRTEENLLQQRMRLDKDKLMRAVMQKEVSDYNKMHQKPKIGKSQNVSKMTRLEEQPTSIQTAAGRTIFSTTSNPPDYLEAKHRFSTVNQEIHTLQPLPDFK